jgi:cytochrome oxidase Cu insertion factor (SCO1/SenC/PrrC family)
MYLMDEDGKFVDFFYGKSTPTEIAGRVSQYLRTGK